MNNQLLCYEFSRGRRLWIRAAETKHQRQNSVLDNKSKIATTLAKANPQKIEFQLQLAYFQVQKQAQKKNNTKQKPLTTKIKTKCAVTRSNEPNNASSMQSSPRLM